MTAGEVLCLNIPLIFTLVCAYYCEVVAVAVTIAIVVTV